MMIEIMSSQIVMKMNKKKVIKIRTVEVVEVGEAVEDEINKKILRKIKMVILVTLTKI